MTKLKKTLTRTLELLEYWHPLDKEEDSKNMVYFDILVHAKKFHLYVQLIFEAIHCGAPLSIKKGKSNYSRTRIYRTNI